MSEAFEAVPVWVWWLLLLPLLCWLAIRFVIALLIEFSPQHMKETYQ